MPFCINSKLFISFNSFPLKKIFPPKIGMSPIIALSNVDFPAPFGPIIETTSFSFNTRSTP